MKSKKNHFKPREKAAIVMESLRTSTSQAEPYRRHNITPHTLSRWRERFVEAGTDGMADRRGDKTAAREAERLKILLAETTLANDILKKTLEAGA